MIYLQLKLKKKIGTEYKISEITNSITIAGMDFILFAVIEYLCHFLSSFRLHGRVIKNQWLLCVWMVLTIHMAIEYVEILAVVTLSHIKRIHRIDASIFLCVIHNECEYWTRCAAHTTHANCKIYMHCIHCAQHITQSIYLSSLSDFYPLKFVCESNCLDFNFIFLPAFIADATQKKSN